MATRRWISVKVNGMVQERAVEPRRTLADFLREELELTGTHLGCEQAACGACSVLLDGEAVLSCSLLAVQAEGHEVTTIEGLTPDGAPTPLMRALRTCHGVQCGFCTPGIVIAATVLLRENPQPTEEQVRRALSGNLCRCTGYQGIIDAVLATARELASQGS